MVSKDINAGFMINPKVIGKKFLVLTKEEVKFRLNRNFNYVERHEIKNINSTEQDLIYEIKIGDVVFDVVYHLRVYDNFNDQWINYDGVCGVRDCKI